MANWIGKRLRLMTFGESHGAAMGGVLDGMPSLVKLDFGKIRQHLDRRRPGENPNTSQRKESDEPEFLSGISDDGITLGTPIGFIVRNKDARSGDYDGYNGRFRPNHADYTYYKKYGIHDFRGGGRASARETVSWVIAGSIARQWLEQQGIEIHAKFIETNNVAETAAHGESTGGIVACRIMGVPVGVGAPVFDKLHSRLAGAIMSINAAKAFEYGDGMKSAYMTGTESMDLFNTAPESGDIFLSNHSGGILGGISNGMPIEFRVYFKPTPTVMKPFKTIDTKGEPCEVNPRGRHDPCVAIRAVPVVESMAALTIADLMLSD